MSVYGNTVLKELYSLENCFDDDYTIMEFYLERVELLNESYKYLHKVDNDDLAKGGSHLAVIWKKEIENMKSEGKDKMISKYMYIMYYAIVGNCFGVDVPAIKNGKDIKYKPNFADYWKISKSILEGKHKVKILKDVEKTIVAAEKFVENNDTPDNKVLIAYYNAYINDLKNFK